MSAQNNKKNAESKSCRQKVGRTAFSKSRDALGAYIESPESYPASVIYHTDDFVAIYDRYPKSSLHLLLLSRNPSKGRMHPFDAFEDPDFLHKVRVEVKKLRVLAARELQRRYGKYSVQERPRQEAMDRDPPSEELPPGRDWEREIMSGIHACPSMNHLHIHVLSVDRYSDFLKHKKHYNSFATQFFIDIDDFPLARNDVRRSPGKEGYLKEDLICWRCGKNFESKLQALKSHLEKEFQEWKHL
jgi:aprataxin